MNDLVLLDRFVKQQTEMLMLSNLLESRGKLEDAKAIESEWNCGGGLDSLFLTPDTFKK